MSWTRNLCISATTSNLQTKLDEQALLDLEDNAVGGIDTREIWQVLMVTYQTCIPVPPFLAEEPLTPYRNEVSRLPLSSPPSPGSLGIHM